MSTYISDKLRDFYFEVCWLALSGAGHEWCRPATDHGGPAGVVALVPTSAVSAALPWPALPNGQPGWVPTVAGIQDAFTAVLRTNGERVDIGDEVARRKLHLAEQHVNVGELHPAQADLLLQVAVFGKAVFR